MIVEVTFAVEVEDPEALFSAFAERHTEEKNDDSVQDVRDEWSDDAGNLNVHHACRSPAAQGAQRSAH